MSATAGTSLRSAKFDWAKLRPWKLCELDVTSVSDPLSLSAELIRYTGSRARRSLFYSRVGQVGIIASSASISVTIILSTRYDDFFFGKLGPAVLVAFTAAAVRLVQIERPHDRWRLYWRAQKALEGETLLYLHDAEPYDDESRDKKFVARLHAILSELSDEWANLTPRTVDVLKASRIEHPR